ncbi:MAG TPA: hypothetical protein VGM23_05830 [Armatimonadota bacterium]|jgi:hypothetical protein
MKRWQLLGGALGGLILALAIYLFITQCLNPPVRYVMQSADAPMMSGGPHGGAPPGLPAVAGQSAAGLGPQQPAPPAPAAPSTQSVQPAAPSASAAKPTEKPANGHPPGAPRATFALVRLFTGLGQLDGEQAPLTAAQAKSILAIMTPLRDQPSLTPAQAEQAQKNIEAVLTTPQRDALARVPTPGPPSGRPIGGPPPTPPAGENAPTGPPSGDGRPGGGMERMNPFNTQAKSPLSARIQAVFTALEKQAGQ